jgi:uncharacterized membrane protein
VKAAAPKPTGEGGLVAASYGSASHTEAVKAKRGGGATLPQTNLFEMRRLEMLSNTIFGVAMTLLAYDLPKAGRFASAPGWTDILNVYAQPVIALAISFVVAGLFWFSHHRRLAVAPEASRGVVFLNLLFLLSIIILPVTNGLYGSYRLDSVVAVIYGIHLLVIALLNGALWILALRGHGDPRLMVTALFPILVFAIGTAIATFSPAMAQFMWCLGFLAPLAGWIAERSVR